MILLLATFSAARAQELKLGSTPTLINKSAILELESTTRGLLLPRIPDTSAAPLPSSPDGMVIYFKPDSSMYLRKGGKWQRLAAAEAHILKGTVSTGHNSITIPGNGGTVSIEGPIANTVPGSTVTASPNANLPDGICIAYAYVRIPGTVRIVLTYGGGVGFILGGLFSSAQTIPANTVFNVTITN